MTISSRRESVDSALAALRCRLSVHYRVHSRQMLCIGGSQIPFGWSFLSIAKVPMQWSEGDIWTTDVRGFQQLCMAGCQGSCA